MDTLEYYGYQDSDLISLAIEIKALVKLGNVYRPEVERIIGTFISRFINIWYSGLPILERENILNSAVNLIVNWIYNRNRIISYDTKELENLTDHNYF